MTYSPDRVRQKREAVKAEEAAGTVADSMDVRRALMDRFHRGEITLEAAQAELKRIKRGAKASGQMTRNQVWIQS